MPSPAPNFHNYEIAEQVGEKAKALLPSQRAFVFAPERFSCISGGFGSGKTYAALLKGLILSAAIPGNVGSFLCFRGTDAEKRLVPLFMEEVCPPAWRKSYNKNNKRCVLRNNSVISFDHIKDATGSAGAGTGTRRIGSNWGWFGVDQGEETESDHFDALISRLRLPRAARKFGFMTINPAGRNWIWEKFFQQAQPWPRDEQGNAMPMPNGKFFQEMRQQPGYLGIVVNSEENRISNGGYVEDAYFDSLLQNYGRAWVERFVWSQFDDFKGQLFPDFAGGLVDYENSSVHVIDDFQIPRHWPLTTGIDVGGDSPWSVDPAYSDEQGNLIIANGFHNRTARVSEVTNWIKRNLPWNENRTTFVLDPENPVARVELSDNGIYCTNAVKDILPGLLRMESYMHVVKHRELPYWYEGTQPTHRFQKFRGKGSPKMFVMKSAMQSRKELDRVKWHPDKPDQMFKTSTERFDTIETKRYIVMHLPEPAKVVDIVDAKYAAMERKDPATAKEWKAYDARIAARKGGKRALSEMDSEDGAGAILNQLGDPIQKYDWGETDV